MHQYRSDITHSFVWLDFSKWLYKCTEIHAPSIFLFFNLNPMEDVPWSEQTLVSLSLGITQNTDNLDFSWCNTHYRKLRKEKNKQYFFSEENNVERSHIYISAYGNWFHFLSANYEMFRLLYHIFPYLLLIIVC